MFSKSVVLRLYCWAILLSLSSASWAADELFKAAQSYESGGIWATGVAVADVNGDGRPDLLVANQCGDDPNCGGIGSVGILLGNGDGSFQAAHSYESGGHAPMALAVGDVNGDGNPDLLVTNSCITEDHCDIGVASVLLGNGGGTFQTAQGYESGGQNATSIAVGDVNGDGRPDLLVANAQGVAVLLGNGDGTFQAAHNYGSGAWSLTLGDVNGDAKPDLLVADGLLGVAVLLGNGDGTFQTARTYSSGGSISRSVAIGDVNRDGRLDLLVANECNGGGLCDHGIVGVLLGNGDGTFQTALTYNSSGLWPFSITVGDVNGDGKIDLLVTNECLSYDVCDSGIVGVLLGEDDGTFQTAQQYKSGGRNAISMALADVNGDGKLDAVVANHIGGVGVLLNAVNETCITPSRSHMDFGNVYLNRRKKEVLTLTNNCTTKETIGAVSFANISGNPADFSFHKYCNEPYGKQLRSGYSCTIAVFFSPAEVGTNTATLNVVTSASGNPVTMSIAATGIKKK
ncbi:MAG: FG-GAP-like repeat-containing protein [Acidobacteriia bacterium]|nr:FG-GAP-like repeat-containing protein [Terriglobia bacterium]